MKRAFSQCDQEFISSERYLTSQLQTDERLYDMVEIAQLPLMQLAILGVYGET